MLHSESVSSVPFWYTKHAPVFCTQIGKNENFDSDQFEYRKQKHA